MSTVDNRYCSYTGPAFNDEHDHDLCEEVNISSLNDRFQESADADSGRAILAGQTTTYLRGLCDLNYLDYLGRANVLIDRLVADRHPS